MLTCYVHLVGLREEQRQLTRHKVLSAVLDLLADGSLDELSVPAVAERSGVSLAAIYRHFPTKDDLLAAAAAEPSRRAITTIPDATGDRLAHHIATMWRVFADNLPLLRHQLASPAGREMRRARLDDARHRLRSYLCDRGIDPESEAGERLISVLLLITGSPGVIELHDRQGLEVDRSIDAAQWAVEALIEATKQAASQPQNTSGKGR